MLNLVPELEHDFSLESKTMETNSFILLVWDVDEKWERNKKKKIKLLETFSHVQVAALT